MQIFNTYGQNLSDALINPLVFITAHPIISLIVFTWLLIWKGIAMWKSARRNSAFWFIILFVVNTFSIGEMLYYLWTKSQDKKEVK